MWHLSALHHDWLVAGHFEIREIRLEADRRALLEWGMHTAWEPGRAGLA